MTRYSVLCLMILFALLVAGCERQSQLLPPAGDCIYCPQCNTNLFLRIQGTSRTSFTKSDYIPLVFDIDIPLIIREYKCPVCNQQFVDKDETGHVTKVYYRRYSWE